MRRSDEHPIDPETAASLEAIDATLAGEPVDPRHAELAELALLLADERPRIEPAFARSLDERVKSQFAGTRQIGAIGGASVTRKLWGSILAGGAAATALAAAVVAVIVLTGGHASSSSSSASSAATPIGHTKSSAAASGAPTRSSAAASSAVAPSAASVPPTANGPTPPANGRKIVQSAQLYLSTAPGRVDDVAQEVFGVVGQQNGIVVRSSVTQTGGADGNAFFQLSMPSSSLPQTMSKLSQLPYAHVASRTDSSQDVNNQYGRATRRLADARSLHTALLKQLAAAITTQQIDSIQAQIHDAERSISSDEDALAALNHRIAFSDVSLTIGARPVPAGPPSHGSGGLTLGRATHDAGRVLTVAAGVALIALAALVPVALVAGLVWSIVAMLTHRRRERALDLA
jgi:Domain of unknown function (DUF4349)